MREIKFRAWDEENKQMYYFDLFDISANGSVVGYNGGGCFDLHDNVIIEQFTGLYDKNGKDIYEGDIFKVNPHKKIYSVGFCDGAYEMVDHDKFAGHLCFLLESNIEIIGNIRENPELLK